MARPYRKYSIAGKRFEDVLRVHRAEQIRELKADNQALTDRVSEMLREKNEEIAAMRRQVYELRMENVRLKARIDFGVKLEALKESE
jgi:cell shape-determining protein MreC